MLHDNMNISRLMVYARRVDESGAKRKSRDSKRDRSFDGGSSKNRHEIQDKHKFKKWGSNQVPSKIPRSSGDRVSNPNSIREKVIIHQRRNKLVESMVKSTMVSALGGQLIALVVLRVVTK